MSGAAVKWSLPSWLFGGARDTDQPREPQRPSVPVGTHTSNTASAFSTEQLAEQPTPQTAREAALLARLRADDPEAVRELMDAYGEVVARVVAGIVKDPAAVDDVVQDVFIWVWNARTRLRIEGSVAAYLIRAGRNLALSMARRQRMHDRVIEDLRVSQPTSGPRTVNRGESEVEVAELDVAIQAALGELPPRRREIFLLHLDHDLPAKEIATILGITPATVHTEVYRATKHLAERLKEWL